MAENTELMTVDNICNRVYVIRGQQVMLDYDLAEIYGYEVKNLNQQVKRNIARFPEDFMFQLAREEVESVKSQIVISREKNFFEGQGGGRRTLPYAFTEQCIYMLATVLRGELAEQQSIFIMRAFREMRHYIKQNQQFVTQSEMHLVSARVSEISVQMSNMADRQKKTEQDIQVIQKSIYVVDDYVNTKTLQLLSQKQASVEVILFTENGYGKRGFLTTAVVNDFIQEYPPLRIKPNAYCHDRLIVLDYGLPTEQAYHCGASSKDAGKKLCAINVIIETSMIHPVIDKLLLAQDKQI